MRIAIKIIEYCRIAILRLCSLQIMVPKAGIEPAWAKSPVDFESTASTNFTTSARVCFKTSKSRSLSREKCSSRLFSYQFSEFLGSAVQRFTRTILIAHCFFQIAL